MPKPEITTKLHLHLNGGDKHSMRVETVMVDGVETQISMGTGTDGSPDFHVTSKELVYRPPGTWEKGDEERLDLLACHLSQEDINDWILERAHG